MKLKDLFRDLEKASEAQLDYTELDSYFNNISKEEYRQLVMQFIALTFACNIEQEIIDNPLQAFKEEVGYEVIH